MFSANEAELETLAHILASSSGRLYRVLVREKQIAQDVNVVQDSEELAGRLYIIATARPGHTTAELETAIIDEVRAVQNERPAPPKSPAPKVTSRRKWFDRWSRSADLTARPTGSTYTTFPGKSGLSRSDFQRYLNVTPESVQRTARQYLGAGRVVLEVVPGKATKITPDPRVPAERAREALAKSIREPSARVSPPAAEDQARQTLPKPGPAVRFALPSLRRAELSNG